MKTSLSVFDYSLASDFFNDLFKEAKAMDKATRELSEVWGFKSASEMIFVLKKKKWMKLDHVAQIAKAIGLSDKEALYWKVLLQFERAATENEKNLYQLFLNDLKGEDNHEVYKTIDNLAVISHWVHMAIINMTTLKNFAGTEKEIYDLLNGRVNLEEIREAMARLLSLQLLSYDEAGKLKATFTKLNTPNDVTIVGVHKYYEQVFNLAIDAIKVPTDKREFQTFSLPINKSTLPIAKNLIRDFRSQFVKAIEQSENGDQVFQMNIQFFPLTDDISA
jgi:uncharacterized protein (TIGR02147 family)